MKKLTTLFSVVFLVFFASSCKNEKSLQSYLVDTSGKEGFFTGDLPVGSLLTAKADVSEEVKETMKSIKKINVAFLKKTEDNTVAYETEKATLKNIFTNKEYKSLGAVKAKGMNLKVYYTGNTDSLDEVIAFGYGPEFGVGVARLLGDNMNPAKVIEMLNSVKMDEDNIKNFGKMFSGK
jgi:DNA-dependent RNA polymerase auxiliary subunit epsilon